MIGKDTVRLTPLTFTRGIKMKSTNPEALMQQAEWNNERGLHEVLITATIARFPTAEDCKYISNDHEVSLRYLNKNSNYFDGQHSLSLHWQGKYEDDKFIPLQLCVGLPDGMGLPVEWFNIEGELDTMIELNNIEGHEPNCPECEKTGLGGNAMLWDSKAEPSWTYTPEGDNREPLKCRDCGFQVGAGKYILKHFTSCEDYRTNG